MCLTSKALIQLRLCIGNYSFTVLSYFVSQFGVTALMFASTYGHTHIVQELLSGGAQIDLQDEV